MLEVRVCSNLFRERWPSHELLVKGGELALVSPHAYVVKDYRTVFGELVANESTYEEQVINALLHLLKRTKLTNFTNVIEEFQLGKSWSEVAFGIYRSASSLLIFSLFSGAWLLIWVDGALVRVVVLRLF